MAKGESQDTTTHGLNGAVPSGVRFGVSVTRYELGFSMVTGSDGVLLAPTINLTYLSSGGLGFDFSASCLREDAYYSFYGVAATAGLVYGIPKTALLIEGGLRHVGGQDGDGGHSNASGPYLGIGAILRVHNYYGIRVDLSGHRLSRFLGTSLGMSIGIGVMILPKP